MPVRVVTKHKLKRSSHACHSAGGHSALRAASSIMDSLCKALGDMPDDVDRLPAFGDHWGSDGFEVSGLDPTESELDKTGGSTAAQGSSSRYFRCAVEPTLLDTVMQSCM